MTRLVSRILKQVIPLMMAAIILPGCAGPSTPTEPPLPTATPPSPTPVINLGPATPETQVASAACTPGMAFLGDVTIPDNTQMRPGESFTKTWNLQNTGTCAWDSGYHLVWVAGTPLAAALSAPVPNTPPGEMITVSVVMTAPSAGGVYFSTWQMQAPDGTVFGEQAFAQIIVPGEGGGSPSLGCEPKMSYVSDVTIPDGSIMQPGAPFVKTWRIRNSGDCAWGAGNQLVFVSGSALGSGSSVPVPDTPSGGEIDISVSMIAPSEPGDYVSRWQIQDPAGGFFGSVLSAKITLLGEGALQPTAAGAAPTQAAGEATPVPPEPATVPPNMPAITLDAAVARQIFQSGKSMGNRPNVFAKVGDSITESISFLTQIGSGRYTLGDHAYLQGVIDYYQNNLARGVNSYANYSVAAAIGWSSGAPLDPTRTKSQANCSGKSPLVCEYDTIKPAVALIMLGTNDQPSAVTSGVFESNLSQIVQISIQRGVIPVISTIPWSRYKDPTPFNAVVFRVGATYNVPVMDYWQLMEAIPNHGLGPDQLHPSLPPGYQAGDFTATGLQYGFNVRNLLALQMLDRLWREVLIQ